jgi:hypothetical protein
MTGVFTHNAWDSNGVVDFLTVDHSTAVIIDLVNLNVSGLYDKFHITLPAEEVIASNLSNVIAVTSWASHAVPLPECKLAGTWVIRSPPLRAIQGLRVFWVLLFEIPYRLRREILVSHRFQIQRTLVHIRFQIGWQFDVRCPLQPAE